MKALENRFKFWVNLTHDIMKTKIVVNLKHYSISSGPNAERFLSSFIGMDIRDDVEVVFALNPIDLRLASNFPELNFYSQHADPVQYGAFTGHLSIESLLDLGLDGTLLNHSERRLDKDTIKKTVDIAHRHDFPAILCAENLIEAGELSELKPEYIAYEPPELIGGNVSVTSAKPEIISEVVEKCRESRVPVLVGAGVKSSDDLQKSIELGAQGVLIASGIVLSKNPVSSLTSLVEKL